jgi:leader peptidase (prepilin peptidase)/N-methyltransferase
MFQYEERFREKIGATISYGSTAMTEFAAMAIVFVLLVVVAISVIDIASMTIPDALNLLLACGGLLAARYLHPIDIYESFTGGVVGGAASWSFAIAFKRFRAVDGLGLGDVKLIAAAGTWTGTEALAPMLLTAASAALLFVLGRSLIGRPLGWEVRLPFGPFLCFGLLCIATPQIVLGTSIYNMLLV